MDAPSAQSTSGKVLVIDDNPIIQRTLSYALRDKGYTVLMSGEISDALKIIRQERLDAILLDLNFPPDDVVDGISMRDGFWALDWLRRLEELKDIPVIIVVSSDDPERSRERAMAAGASAYFHKPVDKHELATAIAGLIARKPAPPSA